MFKPACAGEIPSMYGIMAACNLYLWHIEFFENNVSSLKI